MRPVIENSAKFSQLSTSDRNYGDFFSPCCTMSYFTIGKLSMQTPRVEAQKTVIIGILVMHIQTWILCKYCLFVTDSAVSRLFVFRFENSFVSLTLSIIWNYPESLEMVNLYIQNHFVHQCECLEFVLFRHWRINYAANLLL